MLLADAKPAESDRSRTRAEEPAVRLVRSSALMALALTFAVALAMPKTAEGYRLPTDEIGSVPLRSEASLAPKAPDISAAAGILVTGDGRTLWARDSRRRRAMASTTKIMTAIVVLEHARPSDLVTVPRAAAGVAQGAVNLVPGERVTVRQLVEVMLVASANDAAYALAEHVGGGSVARFVAMMNEKARALGLTDTRYANPHGLDVRDHYSSAADLAKTARSAMQNAEFRRAVALRRVVLPGPGGRRRVFESSDLLLGRYDGLDGVKTGMTNGAGYCFVSSARRGGVELFGVILGTRSDAGRFAETRKLLDWGFSHYRRVRLASRGTTVGTVPVTDYLDRDVQAEVGSSAEAVVFDLGGPVKRRYELQSSVSAPVRAGQTVGTVTVTQDGSVLASAAVIAAYGMDPPSFWQRSGMFFVRTWRALFGPKTLRVARVTAIE